MSLIIPNFNDRQKNELSDLPEVVLAQMLKKEQEPFEFIFLQQNYNLNRSLKSVGLYDCKYWNAFDVLQQVDSLSGLPITIYDFSLPDGIDPFFKNYANQILLYKNDKLKAEIEVYNQIEIEKIKYFLDDEKIRIDNYDDRGFLSTSVWLDKTKKVLKMEWYNPLHEIVAIMDKTGRIKIEPNFKSKFASDSYDDLNQLILDIYINKFDENANLIAAFRSNAINQNKFIFNLPSKTKFVLFDQDILISDLNNIEFNNKMNLIFPSRILEKQFINSYDNSKKVKTNVIESYPAEFNRGESNGIENQIVYWQFNTQSDTKIQNSLAEIFPLLLQNDNLSLLLDLTISQRSQIYNFINEWIYQLIKVDKTSVEYQNYFLETKSSTFSTKDNWLRYLNKNAKFKDKELKDILSEKLINDFYIIGNFLLRVKLIDDKAKLSNIFNKSRLFIDQGIQADLKKQIRAISVGIPIISFADTELVKQSENGFKQTDISQLPNQVNYFINGLRNWNQSLVTDVDLMENYSAKQILLKWKAVLKNG